MRLRATVIEKYVIEYDVDEEDEVYAEAEDMTYAEVDKRDLLFGLISPYDLADSVPEPERSVVVEVIVP